MRRLVFAAILIGLAAAGAGGYRPVLNWVGRSLVVADPLDRADVIVVLSGSRRGERVRQAADLYHHGYAPRVLLSGGEETEGLSVPEVQRRQAVADGIPETALLFETRSTSTAQQARNLRSILEGYRFRRAIVVTSSFHTRRTRYLFRKAFAGSPVEIRVYPVQQDFFVPEEWWTRDQDTEDVVLEYIKLGLALFR